MLSSVCVMSSSFFFFFNDTATTEIYTLSLHDALPIYMPQLWTTDMEATFREIGLHVRSEEHTSELQSRVDISYAVFCLKKTEHRPGRGPKEAPSRLRGGGETRRARAQYTTRAQTQQSLFFPADGEHSISFLSPHPRLVL